MLTKFRIWWISRKKIMTVRDLAFLVLAAEKGYDVPRYKPAQPDQENPDA